MKTKLIITANILALIAALYVFWHMSSKSTESTIRHAPATITESEKTEDAAAEDYDIEAFMEAIKHTEATQPPRITGNETVEEIYNNPYVTHIRFALDNYLNGSNVGAKEAIMLEETGDNTDCGLSNFDKSYYSSPFFVYDVADNEYGGVQTWIVFTEKPDTLFWTWVYRLGWDGEYSLRGFCESGPPKDKRAEFLERMQEYINSDEFGPVL